MLKVERQAQILEELEKHQFLTVVELSKLLNVSKMTIRRDITELSSENKLLKVYGGAQKVGENLHELSTQEKIHSHIEEKIEIGKIINSMIAEDSIIYLGAGTTIFYALPELKKESLVIITNSLLAFNYLIENTSYKTLLTGGEFYSKTEEFIGEIANDTFKKINIDIAFAATNGINNNNITTSQPLNGAVQNAAFSKAKTKCVVADSSKFDKSDMYTFCELTDIDFLITDSKISNETAEKYGKYVNIINEVQ